MRHRLPLVVTGLALAFTWVAVADAGGRVGNRLYRHSSGYLYGQSRPYVPSPSVIYTDGGAVGSGAEGYGWAPDDDRLIRDQRRDRALAAARAINVDYLNVRPAPTALPTRHQPTDTGWDLVAQGESVRGLARFTVARMTAPGNAEAVLGYAIAAAALGDRHAASVALREALALEPGVLSRIPRNAAMDATLTKIVERFTEGDVYATRVANALRPLVDEIDDTLTPPVLLTRGGAVPGPALLVIRP